MPGNSSGRGWQGFALMLPYIEKSNVWNAINFNLGAWGNWGTLGNANGRAQSTALLTSINSYVCPSELPLGSKSRCRLRQWNDH